MKILISTILVLVVYFSNLAFSQELLQRYTVNNGVLTGFGNDEPPKVTLMVDTKTGKTWMLGVVENKPMWLPLSFNGTNPPHILPPPNDPLETSE
jgi:hypothetical protein